MWFVPPEDSYKIKKILESVQDKFENPYELFLKSVRDILRIPTKISTDFFQVLQQKLVEFFVL